MKLNHMKSEWFPVRRRRMTECSWFRCFPYFRHTTHLNSIFELFTSNSESLLGEAKILLLLFFFFMLCIWRTTLRSTSTGMRFTWWLQPQLDLNVSSFFSRWRNFKKRVKADGKLDGWLTACLARWGHVWDVCMEGGQALASFNHKHLKH